MDDTRDLTIFDPMATWKRKDVYNFEARSCWCPSSRTASWSTTAPRSRRSRPTAPQQVDTLWDEVKRFDYPHKYYVDLSQKLWDIQQCLLRTSQM